jgi:GAF domain-containing protein
MWDRIWAEWLPPPSRKWFGMAVAVAVVGWVTRSAVRGMLPVVVRTPLAITALAAVCILLLYALVVAARARPEVVERHEAEDRRGSIWQIVAAASQWLADLACELNTEGLPRRAYAVMGELFYCVPQALAASSQYHRIVLFEPTVSEAGDTELRITRHAGFSSDSYAERLRLPLEGSVAGLAYTRGKSYRTGDVLKDPNWLRVEDDPQKYRALLCAPVVAGDRVLGVLSVDSTQVDAFTEEDELGLGIFARQVAVIITLLEQHRIVKTNQKGENVSVEKEEPEGVGGEEVISDGDGG